MMRTTVATPALCIWNRTAYQIQTIVWGSSEGRINGWCRWTKRRDSCLPLCHRRRRHRRKTGRASRQASPGTCSADPRRSAGGRTRRGGRSLPRWSSRTCHTSPRSTSLPYLRSLHKNTSLKAKICSASPMDDQFIAFQPWNSFSRTNHKRRNASVSGSVNLAKNIHEPWEQQAVDSTPRFVRRLSRRQGIKTSNSRFSFTGRIHILSHEAFVL